MCLESGAYMANMSKCSNCNKNNLKVEQVPADMLEEDISEDDTELEQETVTYNHICGDCNHVVARHKVGNGVCKAPTFDDQAIFSTSSGWKMDGRNTTWTVFSADLQKTASLSCQQILGKLPPWSFRSETQTEYVLNLVDSFK